MARTHVERSSIVPKDVERLGDRGAEIGQLSVYCAPLSYQLVQVSVRRRIAHISDDTPAHVQ